MAVLTAVITVLVTRPTPAAVTKAAPASPPAIHGTFTLWAATPQPDACAPRSEAPDIRAGAMVSVRDGAGAVLATSRLARGVADASKRGCVFPFTVAGIPQAATYSVSVGGRAGLAYPRAALTANGWQVALNLGLPDPPTKHAPSAAKSTGKPAPTP